MDLALQFGIPLEELRERLTERELRQWVIYARQRVMPQHRIESYLAKLGWVIARVFSSKDADIGIEDFVIDFDGREPSSDELPDLEATMEAFQFKPRNRK